MEKKVLRALMIALVLLGAGFLQAGVYLEQQMHSDAVTIMGQTQPARDSIQKIYLENNRMASENDNMTMVVRLDLKKIYFINHKAKSYMVSDLPLKFPPEMEKMFQSFQFQTDVRKTGETRQIGGYNCEGVEMNLTGFMNMKIKMWLTGDIQLPYQEYYNMATEMVAYSPAMKQMMEKMKSLGNKFSVEQEMTGEVMGAKTRTLTKLVKFENKALPAELFAPPAGYKEKPLNFQEMMQQQR